MGKLGFSRTALARATVVPTTCYGIEITGASDTSLARLRRVALEAVATSTQGGNLDAEWMARDGSHSTLDPAFQVHAAPLSFLAAAWWDKWRSHEQLSSALAAARSKLAAPIGTKTSIWTKAVGPCGAALLSAARIGWTISDNGIITTDLGETIVLGSDPPAAVQHAVQLAVRRWRSANVLQHEFATRHLLQRRSSEPGPDVIPAMQSQWLRAAANADLFSHTEDFTALMRAAKTVHHLGWCSKFAPYLLSATANKQWPQAKVASVRHPDWNSDTRCQLCLAADGTLQHRYQCPRILEMIGNPDVDLSNSKMAAALTPTSAALWKTRGIGAFRISRPEATQQEWLQWLRRPGEYTGMPPFLVHRCLSNRRRIR